MRARAGAPRSLWIGKKGSPAPLFPVIEKSRIYCAIQLPFLWARFFALRRFFARESRALSLSLLYCEFCFGEVVKSGEIWVEVKGTFMFNLIKFSKLSFNTFYLSLYMVPLDISGDEFSINKRFFSFICSFYRGYIFDLPLTTNTWFQRRNRGKKGNFLWKLSSFLLK